MDVVSIVGIRKVLAEMRARESSGGFRSGTLSRWADSIDTILSSEPPERARITRYRLPWRTDGVGPVLSVNDGDPVAFICGHCGAAHKETPPLAQQPTGEAVAWGVLLNGRLQYAVRSREACESEASVYGSGVTVEIVPLYLHTPADSAPLVEDGVALIAAERKRQVEVEGWTPEHDAEHSDGALSDAAACYASDPLSSLREHTPPLLWPWDELWWKPGDRIRELTKAGALIAAEIDRLQRTAIAAGGHNG